MVGSVEDAASGKFGLVDRRNGLGLVGKFGQHPRELRGVDRGHLHHRHVHAGLLVQQFAAQRLVEALDGMFGAAVRRLQRNAAVGERGSDLDDGAAVPGLHLGQHGHRRVHVSQVADLGDPPVLLRSDLVERREDGRERDIHPHIDGTQLRLDGIDSRVHRIRIRHIDGHDQGRTPCCAHILGSPRQSLLTAGQQRDLVAPCSEGPGGGPADTSAGAGHHHNLCVHLELPFICEREL